MGRKIDFFGKIFLPSKMDFYRCFWLNLRSFCHFSWFLIIIRFLKKRSTDYFQNGIFFRNLPISASLGCVRKLIKIEIWQIFHRKKSNFNRILMSFRTQPKWTIADRIKMRWIWFNFFIQNNVITISYKQ